MIYPRGQKIVFQRVAVYAKAGSSSLDQIPCWNKDYRGAKGGLFATPSQYYRLDVPLSKLSVTGSIIMAGDLR